MAAEDVPRCPACRRKQTLTPVPESEQLLIVNNACQYCRKLQKTFVDIPSSHRPQFNRSASCPAGSKVSVVTYLPEGENVIDFLTQEEDKENDANDSMDDVKIDIDTDASEVFPRQPAGRVSKQTIFNVILCLVLVLILVVLLYILFVKHSPNDEDHTHHSSVSVGILMKFYTTYDYIMYTYKCLACMSFQIASSAVLYIFSFSIIQFQSNVETYCATYFVSEYI